MRPITMITLSVVITLAVLAIGYYVMIKLPSSPPDLPEDHSNAITGTPQTK